MPAFVDLTGYRFGHLTVIRRSSLPGKVSWECLCDCGKTSIVSASNLRSGATKSCGCGQAPSVGPYIDLAGQRFGKLTVLRYSHSGRGGAWWLCRCDCGKETTVTAAKLRFGLTKSCGCLRHRKWAKPKPPKVERLPYKDLTGQRFGSLTVIERVSLDDGHGVWLCRCDCGKVVKRELSTLTRGKWLNVSCGCRKGLARRRDLTGQRFGRLVALEIDSEKTKPSHVYWRCKCDCGNENSVMTNLLTSGHIQSCGCLQRESISRLGATVGIKNGTAQSKYDWHVKVNGKRVVLRSSYEVIFAKYLLKHRIRFEYEPQRIQLAPDTIYIPDFYLPDTDTWVEVKGYARPEWLRKRAMFERAGYRLIVVTGASIDSYLSGCSYATWMDKNAHKYLRNP